MFNSQHTRLVYFVSEWRCRYRHGRQICIVCLCWHCWTEMYYHQEIGKFNIIDWNSLYLCDNKYCYAAQIIKLTLNLVIELCFCRFCMRRYTMKLLKSWRKRTVKLKWEIQLKVPILLQWNDCKRPFGWLFPCISL